MNKNNNGKIHNGMDYNEVKSLCLDIIEDALAKTKGAAQIEAQKRYNQFVSKILEKLGQAKIPGKSIVSAFESPAMQLDFIEAGKAYIKYATPELCDILSSIIVDRINDKERTLLQIVLSEAMKSVTLLLPTQMATLSLRFVLCHTYNTGVLSHSALVEYLRRSIMPLLRSGVIERDSEFQHLSYTGCATVSESGYSLSDVLFNRYGGLFSNGFHLSNIPNADNEKSIFNKAPNMFMKCLNNDTKYQINAINIKELNEKLEQLNLSPRDKSQFENLYNNYKMTSDQIEQKVIELCPEMEEVFEYWDSSSIKSLDLSSVGIAIGAYYASYRIQKSFDLRIWI